MSDTVVLQIPAKINLSLDITGKRPDGYHTLRSVFQAVDICDTLTISRCDGAMTLCCDDPGIPCDARNLVWKAAQHLLQTENPTGISMHLQKKIPSQAGMGGGSADCAAALLGISRLLELPHTPETLLPIAAKLGADVPFFLYGGTVLCGGIGDILTPLKPIPRRCLVIAKGKEGVSTPEAYRRLDCLQTPPAPNTDSVLARLYQDDLFACCGNAFDAVTDLPEVERIREIMREHGVKPVLSGSGAAVFGGCSSTEQAEKLVSDLREAGFPFVTTTHTRAGGILFGA